MALYQPSFCIPHNQAIDATDENDMTFSFKLNGNNPLVAYNIQIFNNDTNELVYEIKSTENQRAIELEILNLSNYIANQDNKLTKILEDEESYKSSVLKTNFRNHLKSLVGTGRSKLNDMETILTKKKAGTTLTQTEITKYFQYWLDIETNLQSSIGEVGTSVPTTGEYLMETMRNWMDVDPYRTDDIPYIDKTKINEIVDEKAFNKIKEIYTSLKKYREDVESARAQIGASDTTYINDTTLSKARQTLYLTYSEYSNESYFGKDLYESINGVWNSLSTQFRKLYSKTEDYRGILSNELSQQEYALAHLTGGQTNATAQVYKTASASSSNVAYTLQKGAEVTVCPNMGEPPSGWYYIVSKGRFGYIQSRYVTPYLVDNNKYYLEKPIYPINYEGEQNTVYHKLPIDILQNGEEYKWSVTMYWSTSGQYDKESEIDGSLTSIENYFYTRKKPTLEIGNLKNIMTIPFNYVELSNSVILYRDNNGVREQTTLNAGEFVRLIKLVEGNSSSAEVEYIDESTAIKYSGVIAVSNLVNLGLYEEDGDKNYELPSKVATFIGKYEQEQHSSVAYFRWILYGLQYDTEEIKETLKDTGLIPSIDVRFTYDGFMDDQKYGIKLFVQTIDNIEIETELIKFKASYISYPIENMINAENSPIEHGIIVEWSNLRLINGEVDGGHRFLNNLPVNDKKSFQLDSDGYLVFDKDKGRPLSIDWDANQIICTRFDEERPTELKIYYTASGLDDNGDVISKTLTLIPEENTQEDGKVIIRYTIKTAKTEENYDQEIIASQLYWYIIIMKKDGFTIFTKYAQGLFPALDQYPNKNKFTGELGLYPDALTYLEEPSGRVEYNYQTIVDREGNPKE